MTALFKCLSLKKTNRLRNLAFLAIRQKYFRVDKIFHITKEFPTVLFRQTFIMSEVKGTFFVTFRPLEKRGRKWRTFSFMILPHGGRRTFWRGWRSIFPGGGRGISRNNKKLHNYSVEGNIL